jgi:hypothetical protein
VSHPGIGIRLPLTARQYGEVVLTDEASGQGPGTLARKLSRCKPACRQAGRVWRTFCRPGTNFIEHYTCRGTSLIGATNLSPVTKLVAGTGAVSRYNLSRSQKFITVQDLNCVQISVSGCNNHYESVLSVGAKAKSVTNNLPILSVLVAGMLFFL